MFVDDITLFYQWNDRGLTELVVVLTNFFNTSRKKNNYYKSFVIFNKHVSQQFKEHTWSILNMASLGDNDTYLGIPLISVTQETKDRSSNPFYKNLTEKSILGINNIYLRQED